MERNISIIKNHPDFDEHFSRDVIESTREDPKQRIALFANNLTSPAYEGKVIESILCTRECCRVVPQEGEKKLNIELIKEYLRNDDADSRKNAAGIIRNIFSKENIGTVLKSYLFVYYLPSLLKAMVKNESLKDEAKDIIRNIFSKKNIGTVLENYLFVRNLPSLLKAMVKNESLKDEAKDIIENIFSKENMKNKDLLDRLPSLLEAIVENESLKDEARDIIRNIFSKENIGTVLKSYLFVYYLPSLLEAMVKNESLKDEARDIIRNIFSKENIGTVLKNYLFIVNFLPLLEAIVENESLKDEARDIIRNIFSKENIGTVLKGEIFRKHLPSLLVKIVKGRNFKDEAKYIIKNMSSYKNLGSILDEIDVILGRFVSRNIVKGLAKETLGKEYKDFEKKATNFIEKLTSTKGASSMFEEMSNYRNKTEDSASDFIRNILENDSVPEELKSELKALLDDFSAKRREFIPQALIEKEEKTRNRKLAVSLREG